MSDCHNINCWEHWYTGLARSVIWRQIELFREGLCKNAVWSLGCHINLSQSQ